MPKGVAEKGFKMTQNRKNILNLLIEEGGALKSKEGKATSLLHGLLGSTTSSMVSLNATLRELESLGFIHREVEGRRTYAIAITKHGRDELGGDAVADPTPEPAKVAAANVENGAVTQDVTQDGVVSETAQPVPPEDFDWDAEKAAIPGEIDYDILLGVFLKAAIRGMEPSNNGELGYYKQQNELAMAKVGDLEAQVIKLTAENATLVAQLDQLQKNLNIIMSKAEQKTTRGSDPVRKLLSPDENAALDALMRQMPTTRGD